MWMDDEEEEDEDMDEDEDAKEGINCEKLKMDRSTGNGRLTGGKESSST